MSHTFKEGGFIIHHDGDYDGDAEIIHAKTKKKLTIPCEVLVAEHVRSRKIARIEQASNEEILWGRDA